MFSRTACLALLAIALAHGAQARPARCFTTDDGAYACDFKPTDTRGSFEITAPGKPAFALDILSPGVATAVMRLGTHPTPLPGEYRRNPGPEGCWTSTATKTRICAR